jgi:KDO2-lipid IV(A) lauroyltransferase
MVFCGKDRRLNLRVLTDYATYVVVRLFIALVQALPPATCSAVAGGMAWLLTDVVPLRRSTINENLDIALPHITGAERRKLVWSMWHHLLLMVMEIAQAPRKVHRSTWRRHVEVPAVETIIRWMLPQRPSVVISGHYGNFELGGYLLGMFGFPTHTVARQLDNPFLDRFVNRFRGRTGQHMLPKNGSGEMIEQLLAGGGSLTLLGDQAAGRKGCWVPFFGRPASTHKAVALFSLSFEAPTLVIGVRRLEGMLNYHVDVEGAVDPRMADFQYGNVADLTEWYTGCLERLICRAPHQYWWVHRRWKGKVPARAQKLLARRAAA